MADPQTYFHHIVADASLTAQSTGTTATAFLGEGIVSVSLSGTWVATVTLQRSFDDGANWVDIKDYTANAEDNAELGEPMLVRLFIKSGAFTSGTVVVHLGQYVR